jgi:hypothetical protein
MPKHGQKKAGSSRDRVAGAPYDPVSNLPVGASRRTRSGRSGPSLEEDDGDEGKKQREKRVTRSTESELRF